MKQIYPVSLSKSNSLLESNSRRTLAEATKHIAQGRLFLLRQSAQTQPAALRKVPLETADLLDVLVRLVYRLSQAEAR